MSENLRIWDKVSRPPVSALKTILFGRLKGKSDINPQWRLHAMTEAFGPVGLGWSYTIDKLWTEPGLDGQMFAFSLISVIYCLDGKWSNPFTGIGGSMLLEKDKNGIYHNDEAFKMATTDALGVAMKALGVAADIYLGLWDGSKYAPKPQGSSVNADAGKDLPPHKKNLISDMAIAIKDCYEIDDIDSMIGYLSELKDVDEELYLWSLLSSDLRSTIKTGQAIANAKTLESLKATWDKAPKHSLNILLSLKDKRKTDLSKEE